LRRCGQARHAVLKDPAVVVIERQLLTGAIWRLEVLPDAECAIGIDSPGQFDPEFVFFPHLADSRLAMRLPGGRKLPPFFFERDPEHRLPESDPASGMRFLAEQIVP